MFGYWPVGTTAFALCAVSNASGIAVAADALPTFRVYGSSATPVATGTTSIFDSPTLTGVYLFQFSTASGFARGSNYQVVVSYNVGAQPREQVFSFAII
jgi:hypothetical protein